MSGVWQANSTRLVGNTTPHHTANAGSSFWSKKVWHTKESWKITSRTWRNRRYKYNCREGDGRLPKIYIYAAPNRRPDTLALATTEAEYPFLTGGDLSAHGLLYDEHQPADHRASCRLLVKNATSHFSVFSVSLCCLLQSATRVTASCMAVWAVNLQGWLQNKETSSANIATSTPFGTTVFRSLI